LLLLTNSGRLAHELESPQNGFEREYEVRVFGIVSEDKMNRMQKGVTIDGLHYKAKSVSIKKKKTDDSKNTWLTIILDTGKNREVRKLMEFFNLKVNKLIRVRYANVAISGLQVGSYLELHRTKLAKVLELVKEKCKKEISF
jgi:23S rRNA pseudouridine2605 synthase